jgi:hypothetical protein
MGLRDMRNLNDIQLTKKWHSLIKKMVDGEFLENLSNYKKRL